MKTRTVVWLVMSTAFSISPFDAGAQTTIPGFTIGSMEVSETGAATYTIPIQVPPGVNGLQPKLALAYNSNAGNGWVGMGWSLQGFTTMQRCGRTIVHDGESRAVRYDASDKVCYGGRLVAIAGPYGTGNPTEYRTERDSFSRVLSYGNLPGPDVLQLSTKSGLWMEFGGNAQTKIEASGKSAVRVWAVRWLQDKFGNYMSFDYSEDYTNGEYFPTRIDYTGNTPAALAPFASVRLVWEARPDVIRRNVAGSNIRISQRLKNIQTFVGATMVKDYRLAYEQGPSTGRSRLLSVTECSGDGTQCLVPARFTYANFSGLASQTSTGGYTDSGQGWRLADIGAAGKQLFYTHDGAGNHYATRLQSYGGVTQFSWAAGTGGAVGNAGWDVGDLFGDGWQMFYTHSTDGTHKATRLVLWGGYTNYQWTGGHGVGNAGWTLADLFGDGRKVYYTYSTGGNHYATRLKPSQTTGENFSWTGAGAANADWKTGDPFGDGRQLIIYFSGGTVTALRLNEGQTTPEVAGTWTPAGFSVGSQWRMADLFGEGRDVFYTNYGNGTHYAVRLNSDGTSNAFTWTGTTLPGDVGWELADVLGDGRTVYTTHWANGTHKAVRFNADSPTTFTEWTWTDSIGLGAGGWKMGDVFGNGRSVYFTHSNTGTHQASSASPYLPSTPFADALMKVSIGVGDQASVTIDYGYLSSRDTSFYAKDSDAVYPVKDVQGPLYVARQLTQNDGAGNSQQTMYFYTGAKTHLTGGGFLGFRKFDATSVSTGIKVSNTFTQNYPYHGLTASIVQTGPIGSVLNQVTNTYTNTATPSPGGNYYRSDLTQQVTTSNDLNGAAFPTVTTTNTWDSYGNPLTINVSTSDAYTKLTTNTFTNSTSGNLWNLGRLTRSTVASTIP